MDADLHLLLHNLGFAIGGLLSLGICFFVWYRRRGRHDALSITFILWSMCVALFQFTHVLGVMAPDAESSRLMFMFNLSVILIAVFLTHWLVAVAGKAKESRVAIWTVYTTGFSMLIFFILYPESYLVASVPKLYLPFYYEPGPFQIIMRVWFEIVIFYGLFEVYRAYMSTSSKIEKNRYLYVFATVFYGFIVGTSATLLVYDLPFDPAWSSLFGLFPIPLAYCVVKYELMDIKIAAKGAFIYAGLVTVLGVLISILNAFTDYLVSTFSYFPEWFIPVVSSMIAVGVGFFVWKKVRETDLLKYEFVTVVTHKFRTPLTYIKWATDALLEMETDPSKRAEIERIQESNSNLVELTSTLVELPEKDSSAYLYRLQRVNLSNELKKTLETSRYKFMEKGVSITYDIAPNLFVNIDVDRFQFALQILLDNALIYTPHGRSVSVSLAESSNRAVLILRDKGIGIPKEELPYIFNKFYRGKQAMHTDTEGMGIGLFNAKAIIERNNGFITVESAGTGKGAAFTAVFLKA